jgi:broad specificity phosphatase PhoE
MTARLVIVRHGNTFAPGEAPRRVGARTDLPLVESGHEQAQRLGTWFTGEGWRFDRILTSPLLRTRQTAEAIRAAQDVPLAIEPSDLLAEIDHGPDENRSEEEVIALFVTSNGAARFALLADPALLSQAKRLPSLKLRTGAFGVIEIGNAGPSLSDWDRRP